MLVFWPEMGKTVLYVPPPLPPWKTNALQSHLSTWQPSCFPMIFQNIGKRQGAHFSTTPSYSFIRSAEPTSWGFPSSLKNEFHPLPLLHPVRCHHLPWSHHFLMSDNASTHDGFSGASTRIYHWPTFSLVSLHFPVPWNQSDKLLLLESL